MLTSATTSTKQIWSVKLRVGYISNLEGNKSSGQRGPCSSLEVAYPPDVFFLNYWKYSLRSRGAVIHT